MGKFSNNIELLRAMDAVIGYLNDQEAAETWLACGVPDGATDDDYEYIAGDDGMMDSACSSFGAVMRRASGSGWFTNYDGEPPFTAYGVVE